MPIIIPLASGKGGVGKSVISANLASLLASHGKTTVLVDMDFGGSNAHTILGIKNTSPGLGSYFNDKTIELKTLVQALDQAHLFFVAGDSLMPGTANMSFLRKQKLLKELHTLEADYIILDLGAGTHFNTTDVWLTAELGFVVSSPEPTSILNAYSFIKTSLYRLMLMSLPAKGDSRQIVRNFFSARREAGEDSPQVASLADCLDQVQALEPKKGLKLRERFASFMPRVIINMGKDVDELRLGSRLRQICARYLGIAIEYIAFLPWQDEVRQSIIKRQLLSKHKSDLAFVKALDAIALKIIANEFKLQVIEPEDFEDLEKLATDFMIEADV